MATPGVEIVAELSQEADRRVGLLHTQLKEAEQVQRFLAAFSDALRAGHPSEALRVVAGHEKQLELLSNLDADKASYIDSLRTELQSQVEAGFQDLPRDFPAALEKVGLSLDPGSRHPRYSLLDEFIEVRFDRPKLEAMVLPRDGRKIVLGVEPDAVATHVAEEVARLTARPFDPKAFLTVLVRAYQAVTTATGADARENVPLKEMIAELAKDKNFRADEFNVDLSRLVRDKESAGRVALDNARNPKNGILLWQLDQRGYYGYIRVEG